MKKFLLNCLSIATLGVYGLAVTGVGLPYTQNITVAAIIINLALGIVVVIVSTAAYAVIYIAAKKGEPIELKTQKSFRAFLKSLKKENSAWFGYSLFIIPIVLFATFGWVFSYIAYILMLFVYIYIRCICRAITDKITELFSKLNIAVTE